MGAGRFGGYLLSIFSLRHHHHHGVDAVDNERGSCSGARWTIPVAPWTTRRGSGSWPGIGRGRVDGLSTRASSCPGRVHAGSPPIHAVSARMSTSDRGFPPIPRGYPQNRSRGGMDRCRPVLLRGPIFAPAMGSRYLSVAVGPDGRSSHRPRLNVEVLIAHADPRQAAGRGPGSPPGPSPGSCADSADVPAGPASRDTLPVPASHLAHPTAQGFAIAPRRTRIADRPASRRRERREGRYGSL
jgi:hypothetical protein